MKQWIDKPWKRLGMRRLAVPVLALALAAGVGIYEVARPAAAAAAPTVATAAPLPDSSVSPLLALDRAMETLAAHVTPAVVNVTVTSKVKTDAAFNMQDMPDGLQQFFGPQFRQRMQPQTQIEHGLGSGVILSPDGYIVTNEHVVHGAVNVQVTMTDRRILPAKVIGTDPLTDLAVIKVNANNLPNIGWGDATALHPGQIVMAFGNPYGLRFTVTQGIISALNRPNPYNDDARKPGQFIQTDAAINPGNSGGPLVDAKGEVIGINTFLISPSGAFSGAGFAIPSTIARPVVEELIRNGKVEHAYIGVGITDITPQNAKFFHRDKDSGAVITEVQPDSPAAKAGLKVGDVITKIDGQDVSDAGHLQVLIGAKRPGTEVRLEIARDGNQKVVPVTLAVMGKNAGSSATENASEGKGRWGLGISDLTPDVRQELQAPSDLQGAVIERVVPGSPADNAGLSRGEVIQQVDRKDVKTATDLKDALASVPKGQDVLLLVWANGGSTFVVMHAPTGNSNS